MHWEEERTGDPWWRRVVVGADVVPGLSDRVDRYQACTPAGDYPLYKGDYKVKLPNALRIRVHRPSNNSAVRFNIRPSQPTFS